MSGFSEQSLEKKLNELNASQQSIQQLSLWIIHHRKHYQTVVRLWQKKIHDIEKDKKLTLLYLANDVCQNSKKKYPEISKEFGTIMKKVLEHLSIIPFEEKTTKSVSRLLGIWKERQLFEGKVQLDLDTAWTSKKEVKHTTHHEDEPSPAKKSKTDSPVKKKVHVRVTFDKAPPSTLPDDPAALIAEATTGSASSDLLQALLSPNNSKSPSNLFGEDDEDNNGTEGNGSSANADPPDPEELIKALQDLQNAASSDGEVRDKISKFPPEVSDVAQLERLESSDEIRELLRKVETAETILKEYNERLQQELKDRKKVSKMMADFLSAQKDLEAQAEERVEQYREKLEKVNAVRDDLKSHIQSLPDLSKLPNVTGGLAALPSASDLFTMK